VLAGSAALLLAATPAQASFHLNKIREVSAGTMANGHNDAYVELQAYAAGQNFLATHTLTIYDAMPANEVTTCTFSSMVPNGANQMTALVGGSQSPVTPDTTNCNVTGMAGIDATSGAACWATDQIAPVDCVSWGSFSGTLGSPTGTPAPAIPDGMALRRSITPNCPTLLEAADDTNNSATDFSVVAPNPRNNASPITETACSGSGGGGGGGNPEAPNTKIGKVKVRGTTAKVTFSGSSPIGSKLKFKCKLDKKKFKSCKSPKKFKHLKAGKHKVQVKAIDAAGNVDATPAKKKFKV
jgi:hypothetical protein